MVTRPSTAEQPQEMVDEIASAADLEALARLRRRAHREFGDEMAHGFLELLIELRQAKLAARIALLALLGVG